MGESRILNVAVSMDVKVAGEAFRGSLAKYNGEIVIGAVWENRLGHRFELRSLTDGMGITLPDLLDYAIELEDARISYQMPSHKVGFRIRDKGGGELILSAYPAKNWYVMRIMPHLHLALDQVPVIGKEFGTGSFIQWDALQIAYAPGKGTTAQLQMQCHILDREYGFGQEKLAPPNEVAEKEPEALAKNVRRSTVHWKELNKNVGPLFIRRVGGGFVDKQVRIYLDAEISLSILTFSMLELYLGVKLGSPMEFQYGLRGMAITLQKPPLMISGGLYLAGPNVYNGQISLRYQQFALLALGSYAKEEKSGKDSFFAYLMLDYAFGGPPCFYITGLALGFGSNRRIRIPELKKVQEFPFVAAVLGRNGLHAKSSTGEVLQTLSDYIEPCEGMHFITAGVKFTSFGMVESVAIVNVAFGKRFELSLLGTSELSIPPKSKDPVAYGCLNLRAVFAPDDGVLLIEGALSDDTYLFAKDCKLSGGFAFYTWFSGEHAGDFVLSIGGYASGFDRKHYPAVDRVRLNWVMSDNLDLKGEAYFALTPNYLMAGGRLDLTFHMGKLRAWCHAYADFLIRFQPFYYDISLGVNIGISYRLDFLFIHHTFSLEIGADLRLWGPDFAGIAHIKWCILSFTIRFGNGGSAPANLTFAQFQENFLPVYTGGTTGVMRKGCKYARLVFTEGLLGERSEVGQANRIVYCLNGSAYGMQVETAVPIGEFTVNDTTINSNQTVGILPMGLAKLRSTLRVRMLQYQENGTLLPVALEGEAIRKSIPRALWDTAMPDRNAGLMESIYMGCRLYHKDAIYRWLPECYGNSEGWYELKILLQNEQHKKIVQVQSYLPIPNEGIEEEEFELIVRETMQTNSLREQWLHQLSAYSVYGEEELDLCHMAEHLNQELSAPFVLRTLGYRGDGYGS